jgi:hypothetical protein
MLRIQSCCLNTSYFSTPNVSSSSKQNSSNGVVITPKSPPICQIPPSKIQNKNYGLHWAIPKMKQVYFLPQENNNTIKFFTQKLLNKGFGRNTGVFTYKLEVLIAKDKKLIVFKQGDKDYFVKQNNLIESNIFGEILQSLNQYRSDFLKFRYQLRQNLTLSGFEYKISDFVCRIGQLSVGTDKKGFFLEVEYSCVPDQSGVVIMEEFIKNIRVTKSNRDTTKYGDASHVMQYVSLFTQMNWL